MAERKAGLMHGLRMRTALLLPLLLLSFGGTPLSLLILRTIVKQQARAGLASDLQHSVRTYQNLAQQRRQLLMRESALLADQPLLKSLMVVSLTHTTTSADTRTIADEGQDFWRVSGSDFFALLDRDGKLLVSYNRGRHWNARAWNKAWRAACSIPRTRRCWCWTTGFMRSPRNRWCLAIR